jgi:hypothetical protein
MICLLGILCCVVWQKSPWWWRQFAPLQRRLISTRLYGATNQKNVIIHCCFCQHLNLRYVSCIFSVTGFEPGSPSLQLSPKWSISFRFTAKYFVCTSHLPRGKKNRFSNAVFNTSYKMGIRNTQFEQKYMSFTKSEDEVTLNSFIHNNADPLSLRVCFNQSLTTHIVGLCVFYKILSVNSDYFLKQP